jgi:UDP-N-acetylglucosamine:LPS N-acetylglucosamine transferase
MVSAPSTGEAVDSGNPIGHLQGMTGQGTSNRVLAIASGGGHWEQLMALRPAFSGHEVHFATTIDGLGAQAGVDAYLVPDCNRDDKLKALRCLLAVGWLLLRLRPDCIVSTGALPGFFAIAIGRRLGMRTMWIDSIANAEEMSMAGRLARGHADRWLSQWPAVADAADAEYHGSVL